MGIGSFLGSLAKTVAPSLIDGVFDIFGAKLKRRQDRADQMSQFSRLRAAAVAGGFNPLTALLATGGAGFQVGAIENSVPLASARALSGVMRGVSDVLTGKEAERVARQKAEDELRDLELQVRKSQFARRTNEVMANSVPQLGGSVVRIAPMKAVRRPFDGRPAVEEGREPVTNPYARNGSRMVDPRRPDTEGAAARYGDIAQEAFGLWNFITDFSYTRKLNNLRSAAGDKWADWVHEQMAKNPKADLEAVIDEAKKKAGIPEKTDLRPDGSWFDYIPSGPIGLPRPPQT